MYILQHNSDLISRFCRYPEFSNIRSHSRRLSDSDIRNAALGGLGEERASASCFAALLSKVFSLQSLAFALWRDNMKSLSESQNTGLRIRPLFIIREKVVWRTH